MLPFVTTWVDPEDVVSEISQTEKPHDFTRMWNIKMKAKNEQLRQANKNS